MATLWRYWQLVRLDSSGKTRTDIISKAKNYFEQRYPLAEESDLDDINDRAIATALWQVMSQEVNAFLCLRCYISHQILQVCIQLNSVLRRFCPMSLMMMASLTIAPINH
jgi:hypothetical protein